MSKIELFIQNMDDSIFSCAHNFSNSPYNFPEPPDTKVKITAEPVNNMTQPGTKEFASIKKIATSMGPVTLLRARYLTHYFTRHTHDDFPLGVIEDGALAFFYRGANIVAPRGHINLANPGDPHTGQPADARGWSYRMFYFDIGCVEKIMTEIGGETHGLPFFRTGVIDDPNLAADLLSLHREAEIDHITDIEIDERLFGIFEKLIFRHAVRKIQARRNGTEHGAVRTAKDYIREHLSDNISLGELSCEAGLSPFHLTRVFARTTGLPPHAYLIQTRISRARKLLEDGMSIADIALDLGFADQSHFHRKFKSIVGITPSAYRKIVQD
jgi:AraC-like DNA-binding protein